MHINFNTFDKNKITHIKNNLHSSQHITNGTLCTQIQKVHMEKSN